ncbi:MAG TPA: ABC transporter permease [Phnomibacter sp.]|nr:ABC transporter permease [Phnomibacter sp.]
MIRNFFKTAWRNIVKQKTFSVINIAGLSIGLACFFFIALYVLDELSFDKHHEKADRIYRIDGNIRFGGSEMELSVSADPMGATLKKDYPEVEQFARIYTSSGSRLVKKGAEYFDEVNIAFVDSTVFDVFSFPAVAGNTAHALDEPNTVVISESTAKKYFGSSNSAVGQTIETNDKAGYNLYKVTAVIKDMPTTGHLRFDFMFSMDNVYFYQFGNFLSHNFHTYVLLKPGTNPRQFDQHFKQVIAKYVMPQASQFMQIKSIDEFEKAGNKLNYSLTPLTDIHLHSNKVAEIGIPGNRQYVSIFAVVALFILILACVNFINLSTANSGSRAREIGIRKVLGSQKARLIGQFMAEAILTSVCATMLALAIVWAGLSYFNALSAKAFTIQQLLEPMRLAAMLLVAVLVGLLAGAYPAFYISSFKPIAALKGKLHLKSHKSYLRNALVVFQFFIAMVLIIGTIVVYKQLSFIQHSNIGFNKEQVLIVDGAHALDQNKTAFKNAVLKLHGVQLGTTGEFLPVSRSSRNDNTFSVEATTTASNSFNMQSWRVDYDYIPTLDMQMVQGRNFSREFGSDSNAIIINETAATLMGGGNVIGRKLYTSVSNTSTEKKGFTVIGVVKNFHFASLRQNIDALSMHLGDGNNSMAFKVSTSQLSTLITQVEKQFKSMALGKPFSYRFLDSEFDFMYKTEQRMGGLALVFSILAIAIACLGLFGLATYMAQQRIKEIGVRKVLGASLANIVVMLSVDFVKLVLVAALIAFPVGWIAMNNWLQDFAFRTTINWWIFPLAACIGLLIALLTVTFQAIKAAMTNPVKSLRAE